MKGFIGMLCAAAGLTSCHDAEGCLEFLCSSQATITLSRPMSEGYDLSVRLREHDLSTRCPGSVSLPRLVLNCDLNTFTVGGDALFGDAGAPSHLDLVVSATDSSGRKVADNVALKTPVSGPINGKGCAHKCYRASAKLETPSVQ